MTVSRARRAGWGGFVLLGLFVLARCAGSGPAVPAAPPAGAPEAPRGPAYTTVFFDAGALRQRDERTGEVTTLLAGARYAGPRVHAPAGDRLAFGYVAGDSSHLAVLDPATGAVHTLHTAARNTVYTAAWSPDGTALAFGFYAPRRTDDGAEEMGPGGIRIATSDGPAPFARAVVRDAGCRAARAVEAWLPGGRLVVRDQRQWDRRTLYVVSPEDCADQARIDARKMHAVTFSADGRWMAYLERNLRYNRENRAYEPDTTLFVADAYGNDPRRVAGPEARPRRPAWSPRGAQLAYDRLAPDNPAIRQIYFYEPAEARHTVLSPEALVHEANLRWSPSATRFVFDRRPDAVTFQKVVRIFGGYRVVDETTAAGRLATTWGWLDDEHLVLLDDGRVRLVDVNAERADTLHAGSQLLHLKAR